MNITRVQPNNQDAERAVLGGLLQGGAEAIASVADILPAEAFYSEKHQKIYEAALRVFEKGEAIDMLSVAKELKSAGHLDKIVDAVYLDELHDSTPDVANIKYYADLVLEEYRRRKLIYLSVEIYNQAQDATTEVDDIVGAAEDALLNMDGVQKDSISPVCSLIKPASEYIEEAYRSGRGIIGIGTGFPDLDKLTSGFRKSNLIIVAGRPGMGKSMFIQNVSEHVAIKEKVPVLLYSPEMSREEIVMRMIASTASVNHYNMTTGRIGENDWGKIARAISTLSEAPIYIDDEPGLNAVQLLARCRRAKLQFDIGMVFVDYLQLMKPVGRHSTREQEVSSISQDLKNMAKTLGIPLVVCSQLSRSPEGRPDKRPVLSDLRGSGGLEQDADVVLFLYRDGYYTKNPSDTITEVDVAKQRNGPSGVVELYFDGSRMKFGSRAKE